MYFNFLSLIYLIYCYYKKLNFNIITIVTKKNVILNHIIKKLKSRYLVKSINSKIIKLQEQQKIMTYYFNPPQVYHPQFGFVSANPGFISAPKQCIRCKKIGHWSDCCPYKWCESCYEWTTHRTEHCAIANTCPRIMVLRGCHSSSSKRSSPRDLLKSSSTTCRLCYESTHKTEEHVCYKCRRKGAHKTSKCPY